MTNFNNMDEIRLHTEFYENAYCLIAWLSNKKPSMLEDVFLEAFSEKNFDEWKEQQYKTQYDLNKAYFKRWELDKGKAHGIELIAKYYSEKIGNVPLFKSEERINYLLKQKELLSDKEFYINTLQVPIAMFSSKQEKWLKWHCPLKFIRQYLLDKGNNKEHWYYRLFFKY